MLHYFQILGLPETADVAQIKKAYRIKAKQYHPDFNKEPGAQQKFIEITQAYDILLDFKAGKFVKNTFTKKYTAPAVSKEELERRKREAAKKRAQKFAEMRFQEFAQTDYYKVGNALEIVVNHLLFLLGVFLFFVLPFIMYAYGGIGAIAGAVVTAIISLPLTWPIFKDVRNMWNRELIDALRVFLKSPVVHGLLLTVVNVVLYCIFSFDTVIPTEVLNFILVLLMLGTLLLAYLKRWKYMYVYPLVYAPLALNLFFTLNSLVSFNTHTEQYPYEKFEFVAIGPKQSDRIGMKIYLPEGKYDGYDGIVFFKNKMDVEIHNCIEYTFKTGMFGIRVLKDHRFYTCEAPVVSEN